MKRFVLFATLALIVVAVAASAQTPRDVAHFSDASVFYGGSQTMAKASLDTVYLVGNPGNPDQVDDGGIGPIENGTFEDAGGNPSWNGWTHEDGTFSNETFWNVSDFNAVNGTYSYWCGQYFDEGTNPGYGNDYLQIITFSETVADPGVASAVSWEATLNHDSEPGWDFTYFEWNQGGVWNTVGTFDGTGTDVAFRQDFTYQPGDYVGSNGDEIHLRVRATSDGNTSDQDGLYPSDGLCQIDDVSVTVAGTQVDFEDFEDQVADRWIPDFPPFVGDFTALYVNLQDEDPCFANFSAQVAFIDDGVVVPGTGGTPGQTWRYGPGGYIVNNTGGLAGPDYFIDNFLISPKIEWPAGAEASFITWDCYSHMLLGDENTWPGVFWAWNVRGVTTGNPDDLDDAAWSSDNFVRYGGPSYLRPFFTVTSYLPAGRTHVQMALECIEIDFGWVGTDGTPAPYFDNVNFVAYPFGGPGLTGRAIEWLQDAFPASGDIDLVDLSNNSIPLDSAYNIDTSETSLTPGDTMTFDCSAVRAGSVLNGNPTAEFRIRANPLFNDYRTNLPAGATLTPNYFEDGWSLIEGSVECDTLVNNGVPVADRWALDMPDENFFFPGDVMKYFIRAEDDAMGDIGVSTMPGDTTGFASFVYDNNYNETFIVRGLPTVFDAAGTQPTVLFWNDYIGAGFDNEWRFALNQLGFLIGVDYDMYATNGASSGVGNGLGSRATSAQLAGYSTLLYDVSTLGTTTITNGDLGFDGSNDIGLLTNWFSQGDKNALFFGDGLITDLNNSGADAAAFLNTYFSVNLEAESIVSLIGNQTAPLVTTTGNGVITSVDEWIAFGGCPGINLFDGVTPVGSAVRIAEFTDPQGNGSAYPYSAATYYNNTDDNSEVISFPYSFRFFVNAPGWTPPAGLEGLSARTVALDDIMGVFGEEGGPIQVDSPDLPKGTMTVENYPNPFNPQTTIKLNLPKASEVSLKVFNVRGELVRTLVDGQMVAGEHSIVWDGKTNSGNQTASGVYFYETRTPDKVVINKMALVK